MVMSPILYIGIGATDRTKMKEGTTFQEFMRRVRAGDETAAAELVRTYEPAIRRAARVRLADTHLRRLFDSMDISQSVFRSFFIRSALGEYDLEKPEQLLSLLLAMSRKKLADHAREQLAACRDIRRDKGDQLVNSLPAPGVEPDRRVAAKELLEQFRDRLSEQERQVAERRALGQSWKQIAEDMGGTPDGRRKQLSRAVNRIAQEMGLDEFTAD
jgi:RNA polymerase sigma-70 factor (ECF subfamily)